MSDTIFLRFPVALKPSAYSNNRLAWAVNVKVFTITIALFILFLLGFYLFQVGEITKGGYLLQSYKLEMEKIAKQNLTLRQKAAEIASLEKVEGLIQSLGFVEASEVKYLPIMDEYLAKKNY